MQAPSITLTPAGNGVHVIDSAIAGTDPAARQKPLYADVFDDGSCLLVPLLSGRNPTALRHELADHPAVVTSRLLAREHCHTLSTHVEPGPPLTGIRRAFQYHALVCERPGFFSDGRLSVTLGGTEPELKGALDALPGTVSVDVERVGDHDPVADSALSVLTERQQEALDAAVMSGYYESPRRTTPAELGVPLDCPPDTADDPLREAERTVPSAVRVRPPGRGSRWGGRSAEVDRAGVLVQHPLLELVAVLLVDPLLDAVLLSLDGPLLLGERFELHPPVRRLRVSEEVNDPGVAPVERHRVDDERVVAALQDRQRDDSAVLLFELFRLLVRQCPVRQCVDHDSRFGQADKILRGGPGVVFR
jgi:hypothetical protein